MVVDASVVVSRLVLLPEVAGAVARRTGDPRLARRAVDAVLRLPALRRVLVDDSRARRPGSPGGSVSEGPMPSISRPRPDSGSRW